MNEAIPHYWQTIRIQSFSGQARHNIGLARAHTNLASALLKKNELPEAKETRDAAQQLVTSMTSYPNEGAPYLKLRDRIADAIEKMLMEQK